MKDNSGTAIVSPRTNYLSHFTASSNAVMVEYLLKMGMGESSPNCSRRIIPCETEHVVAREQP